ncbi:unnamed protein product [Gordionus sp. m RMFG-2023]|uniref:excitatory amino acid transporter-like n=1 Tax=Gordionus sp. m RMFG-2023 TaxID=3053472 RepID=UPI0030E591A2
MSVSIDNVQVVMLNNIYLYFKKNSLLILTISSVIVGAILGIGLKYASLSEQSKILLVFPGDLFMNMLKMLVLPLIASSLITAVAQTNPKMTGIIGIRSMIYYIVTTFLAVFTGIFLVMAIRPGSVEDRININKETTGTNKKEGSILDSVLDLLRNLVPENLIRSTFQTQKTSYAEIARVNSSEIKYRRIIGYEDNMNTLGIIMFSLFFGAILCALGDKSRAMIALFSVLNDVIMKFVILMMWYSPLGIMCLIASKIVETDNLGKAAKDLGSYMLTVIMGLFIHLFISLPLIYFVLTKKNPLIFMKAMLPAIITALATASSSATLPFTFQCTEENLHIDKRITRFVLPIGATVNMDGTALYEAVAALFLARLNGITLGFDTILIVSLTATFASIGAASIPGAGLITMIMVLNSINVPAKDIAVLLPVDWLLDRLRTTVNILGDAYGACIVDHLCRKTLDNTVGQPDVYAEPLEEKVEWVNPN